MRTYGLVGYPLGHSFSKKYFTEKFERESLSCSYENYEIPHIEDLRGIIAANPALVGLNVTIPYKEQVIPLLDEVDPSINEIGSVNTIRITHSVSGATHLKGFNSDVYGFEESLKPFLQPQHTSALILGTGGASKAVKWTLGNLQIDYQLVSRSGGKDRLRYEDLTEEVIASHKLIVNTTPLGTFPKNDTCPDIPYQYLTPQHLLFDLVYNPQITLFLQKGLNQGATIKNGLEMLHLQAIRSWEIWNETKD